MDDPREAISRHWAERGDLDAIEAQLRRAGRDPASPTLEDLAASDQLHAGGLASTRQLARWAAIAPGARVLDVGAGLGGAARCLASEAGALVTALDLGEALVAAGAELTSRLGLASRVRHVAADFLEWEPDGAYDVLWLQHVDIHVADKGRLYARCSGALAPEAGRVLWHDWLAGPAAPATYPVPWSRDGSISWLASEPELRAALAAAGLELTRLEPIPERTAEWFGASRSALTRVLSRGAGSVVGRERLGRLLEEVEGVLDNIEGGRLVPFFGEARRGG